MITIKKKCLHFFSVSLSAHLKVTHMVCAHCNVQTLRDTTRVLCFHLWQWRQFHEHSRTQEKKNKSLVLVSSQMGQAIFGVLFSWLSGNGNRHQRTKSKHTNEWPMSPERVTENRKKNNEIGHLLSWPIENGINFNARWYRPKSLWVHSFCAFSPSLSLSCTHSRRWRQLHVHRPKIHQMLRIYNRNIQREREGENQSRDSHLFSCDKLNICGKQKRKKTSLKMA